MFVQRMLTLEEVVVNGEGRLVLSQVVPLVRSLKRRLEEDGIGEAMLHSKISGHELFLHACRILCASLHVSARARHALAVPVALQKDNLKRL